MKKILVTGGAGFVGSNLCLKLLNDNSGCQVICLDNLRTGLNSNLEELQQYPNFKFIKQNIIETFELEPVDEIYHLASPASPPHYQKDPVFTFQTCIWGTFNMLQLALKHKAKFLLSSTSEIYGDPEVSPQPENYRGNVNPIGPRACYDEGKRGAETLTFDFLRNHPEMEVKVVRIFNTYGPRMDPKDGRVVSNFITQALQNKDITIYGQGTQTRSFQFVDDLVDGIIATMSSPKLFTGPVNLGNPDEFSIKDLAKIILELIPVSTSKIVYKDLPIDDPMQRKPDISLAKKTLDWEPKIDLKKGLKKTIQYFQSVLELA